MIAPDLRGALGGESDAPKEAEAYHIEKYIAQDVAGVPISFHFMHLHTACCCDL